MIDTKDVFAESDPGSRKPWWDLSEKVALVSGATGWFGPEIAHALANLGATVFVTSRSSEKLTLLSEKLNKQGLSSIAIACDLNNKNNVDSLIENISNYQRRLDILVNNAHSFLRVEDDKSSENLPFGLLSNLEAFWNLTSSSVPLLKTTASKFRDASIINIASMYGKVSPYPHIYEQTQSEPNPIFYGATKASIIQMTKWLACNLGKFSIRVNSISPGAFPNDEVQSKNPEFVNALARQCPLGRIGKREEIAGAVSFLAGSGSTFITGSDMSVDGGWTAW